jgi:alkylation response protein AidB-like acyl-CoA dehydrogenase
MFQPYRFDEIEVPEGNTALRAEVREFLSDWKDQWTPWERGLGWTRYDRTFSEALGKTGWIGMCWPKQYGGSERTMLERHVVIEELLAVGAPVGAHWISDRQSGPLILKAGTEEQRQKYLPEIARGEACFCIGLSEPDSGSDLASVRTKAEKVDGGWRINGRKIWTTNAHKSEYMIALLRTEGTAKDRHSGLSQFVFAMDLPGITIRQIEDLTGEAHFNEVTFDDVFIDDGALIGNLGEGWAQVTAELAFERSGPDRYMSSFQLLELLVDHVHNADSDRLSERLIGAEFAKTAVLRQMSVSVAGMLQDGILPNQEAAVVKDLGTDMEQRLPEIARAVVGDDFGQNKDSDLAEINAAILQVGPTFSLRGGTREIIRGIMAKGLGLR